jgi:hypothetical protein
VPTLMVHAYSCQSERRSCVMSNTIPEHADHWSVSRSGATLGNDFGPKQG